MQQHLQQFDDRILFFIREHMKAPYLDRVMVFITGLGNSSLIWLIAVLIFLAIRHYQKCGMTLLCSILLSNYLGDNLLKPLIGRIRPCNRFPDIPLLIPAPHSPSFPSGHTMVGFASAMVIYYFDKRLGILSFILASLMAFSRLYLFVHYPTDILGGIFYGILAACIMILLLRSLYRYFKYLRDGRPNWKC